MNHLTIEHDRDGVMVRGEVHGQQWMHTEGDYGVLRNGIVQELQRRALESRQRIDVHLTDLDRSVHALTVAADGAIYAELLDVAAVERHAAGAPAPRDEAHAGVAPNDGRGQAGDTVPDAPRQAAGDGAQGAFVAGGVESGVIETDTIRTGAGDTARGQRGRRAMRSELDERGERVERVVAAPADARASDAAESSTASGSIEVPVGLLEQPPALERVEAPAGIDAAATRLEALDEPADEPDDEVADADDAAQEHEVIELGNGFEPARGVEPRQDGEPVGGDAPAADRERVEPDTDVAPPSHADGEPEPASTGVSIRDTTGLRARRGRRAVEPTGSIPQVTNGARESEPRVPAAEAAGDADAAEGGAVESTDDDRGRSALETAVPMTIDPTGAAGVARPVIAPDRPDAVAEVRDADSHGAGANAVAAPASESGHDETPQSDAPGAETPHAEALPVDVVQAEALPADAAQADAPPADAPPTDAVQAEALPVETPHAEALRVDAARSDAPQVASGPVASDSDPAPSSPTTPHAPQPDTRYVGGWTPQPREFAGRSGQTGWVASASPSANAPADAPLWGLDPSPDANAAPAATQPAAPETNAWTNATPGWFGPTGDGAPHPAAAADASARTDEPAPNAAADRSNDAWSAPAQPGAAGHPDQRWPQPATPEHHAQQLAADQRLGGHHHAQQHAPQQPASPQFAPDQHQPHPGAADQTSAPHHPHPGAADPNQAQPHPVPDPPFDPNGRPTRNDLVRTQNGDPQPPAATGWRAAVRKATFGAVKLKPGPAEREHRAAIASVQRSLAGPKTIVVLNPKGGAHKTTATLMIAATFGVHRGGNVLAWDNNETQGTLAARSLRAHHANTAVQLLRDVDRFNDVHSARFGDLDQYVRTQGDARFDVLASDDDPTSPTIMSGDDFRTLHDMLTRFYRVIVVDTGNNPRASNWEASVEAADQLVIVSTVRDDTASVAAGLADRLHAHGLGEKLQRGVTILSEPDKRSDPGLAHRLTSHFSRITKSVVVVPYEPAFVGGGILNLETLRDDTREAWLMAAAQIAEGLNE